MYTFALAVNSMPRFLVGSGKSISACIMRVEGFLLENLSNKDFLLDSMFCKEHLFERPMELCIEDDFGEQLVLRRASIDFAWS